VREITTSQQLMMEGKGERSLVNSTTKDGHCSCMFFELYGIPCCHLIHVLQSPSLKAIP
jgi:hypothetical protein